MKRLTDDPSDITAHMPRMAAQRPAVPRPHGWQHEIVVHVRGFWLLLAFIYISVVVIAGNLWLAGWLLSAF